MHLKEKKYFKNLPPFWKSFSAQGAKKVDYGIYTPKRNNVRKRNFMFIPGPSCSKLRMSLVNKSLNFKHIVSKNTIIFVKNWAKVPYIFFSKRYEHILDWLYARPTQSMRSVPLNLLPVWCIGVGRFRILGGPRCRILGGGGGKGGPNSQQAHDVVTTSMRRHDVASTSFRRHVPTRFVTNQCQMITFLILKSDIIENSRIELKGIVLLVPLNQIKVTFIIILPFCLVH